jgi:hypothetical protein
MHFELIENKIDYHLLITIPKIMFDDLHLINYNHRNIVKSFDELLLVRDMLKKLFYSIMNTKKKLT